jgi:hypothetical protein
MQRKIFIIASALALVQAVTPAGLTGQTVPPAPPLPSDTSDGVLRRNSLGLDFLVSNGGFGLGTFYRREFSDEFSAFVDFSVSEAKDDNEVQYFDWYGQSYTVGKINRFLVLPLYLGVQKRFFKDEILDNFRPYVSAAAGPAMIYVFPEREEYFTAIGHGRPKYTAGGYVGLGAYFGSETSNLLGLSIRYYYVPYPGGLEGLEGVMKKDFGGFFITLNFGNAW